MMKSDIKNLETDLAKKLVGKTHDYISVLGRKPTQIPIAEKDFRTMLKSARAAWKRVSKEKDKCPIDGLRFGDIDLYPYREQ